MTTPAAALAPLRARESLQESNTTSVSYQCLAQESPGSGLGNSAEMSELLRITDTHTSLQRTPLAGELGIFFEGRMVHLKVYFEKVLPVTVLRFGFVVLCFAKKYQYLFCQM